MRDYVASSDAELPLRVKVAAVEGVRPRAPLDVLLQDAFLTASALGPALAAQQQAQQQQQQQAQGSMASSVSDRTELFVIGQVFAENRPLTLPLRTSARSGDGSGRWDEWITFPVKIADLPLNAQVCLTVWELYGPHKYAVVGGTTLRLFDKTSGVQPSTLREGRQKLLLWLRREADGTLQTTTPSETAGMEDLSLHERLQKKYEDGLLPRVDWLDRHQEALRRQQKVSTRTDQVFLHVQLPKYDLPIVWEEKTYDVMLQPQDAVLVAVWDPEALRESPVEAKHVRLSRGHRSSPLDRDLKPNTAARNDLAKILAYPPTRTLSTDEQNLVWKFRFYLTREKKALTKFIKSINWESKDEERQALELIEKWAAIDTEDALELLGPAFRNRSVRAYAVSRLRQVNNDDEILQLFLLQLVQALKYEDARIEESALCAFLIERAIRSPVLANYLYWYIKVEGEGSKWMPLYAQVLKRFLEELVQVRQEDGNKQLQIIKRQEVFVSRLVRFHQDMGSLARPKRVDKLRAMLADDKNGMARFEPMTLPLDPTVRITGVVPEKANVFKSAKMPFFLTFTTDDHKEYSVVFKSGDDMGQDQLVIMMIQLMDRLLQKENMDLHLTPYKVLATGKSEGMVQFIKARAVSEILADYNNDLQMFLRKHNQDLSAPYGIAPAVMDTYIKSCAGYCVITFLLGVGDRHLENLLMTTSGHLFHIDFGYILGKDPKMFPPPMKLSYEMVQCMGGVDSKEAALFRSYCYLAFNTLRKSANLILNLFTLMLNANVPDIRDDPERAVAKLLENFQLNKSDEEAIAYFSDLINTSLNAMMPQMLENIHKLAQYFRK